MSMFEGFADGSIEVDGASIFARWGGAGPPVLLLHGHPRTSATWHRVTGGGRRQLQRGVRGPSRVRTIAGYRLQRLSRDLLEARHGRRHEGGHGHLGHDWFAVVGHDRGDYVALRLALDNPRSITRAAFLDCIPISEHLDRITPEFATAWWHWFFFAQRDTPERVINTDPDAWYHGDSTVTGEENYAEFREATRNPAVVRAMLGDYRAGLTVDRADEETDRRSGSVVGCPVLVLWWARDDLEELHGDPISIWRRWATDVGGHAIDSGHHLAEEAPGDLVRALVRFLQ